MTPPPPSWTHRRRRGVGACGTPPAVGLAAAPSAVRGPPPLPPGRCPAHPDAHLTVGGAADGRPARRAARRRGRCATGGATARARLRADVGPPRRAPPRRRPLPPSGAAAARSRDAVGSVPAPTGAAAGLGATRGGERRRRRATVGQPVGGAGGEGGERRPLAPGAARSPAPDRGAPVGAAGGGAAPPLWVGGWPAHGAPRAPARRARRADALAATGVPDGAAPARGAACGASTGGASGGRWGGAAAHTVGAVFCHRGGPGGGWGAPFPDGGPCPRSQPRRRRGARCGGTLHPGGTCCRAAVWDAARGGGAPLPAAADWCRGTADSSVLLSYQLIRRVTETTRTRHRGHLRRAGRL